MSGLVRVLLYNLADDEAGIEAAYHKVSTELARVPGLLGNELLRSVHNPRAFLVLSTWRDRAAFDGWEQGTAHKGDTAPLRPYHDRAMGTAFGVYQVAAEYHG